MSDAAAPAVVDRPPPRAWIARLVWVAALLALDLWSKSAVFAWLTGHPELLEPDRHGHARLPLVGDWLAFMLSLNPGMAWSMDFLPAPLLVLGRGLAVLFLGWLLVRCERGRPWLLTALLLILAGALGNLCDNLLLAPDLAALEFGKVRDFIDVYFVVWDWHFPTFNVADSCISVGAVFLVLSSLRRAPETVGGSA